MNRPDRGIHSNKLQNSQQLQHQLGLDLCQLFCKQYDGRSLRSLSIYAMRSVVLEMFRYGYRLLNFSTGIPVHVLRMRIDSCDS